MTPSLQILITVIVMIITILEYITTQVKGLAKKTVQAVKSTTTKASHNELLQNIKDSYKTTILAITIATTAKDYTNHTRQAHTSNRNIQNYPDTQKTQ